MGMAALFVATAWGWDERGPEGVATGRVVAVSDRFVAATPDGAGVDWTASFRTPSADLGFVARETARELREQRAEGTPLAQAGMFAELGYDLDDVLATLDLVARVADEDRGAAHKRLEDPAWVRSTFDVVRWLPDRGAAAERKIKLDGDELRLTKYLVYQVDGSATRVEPYTTALYALPNDERTGSVACEGPTSPCNRFQYDRIQIYGGIYEPGGAAAGQAEPVVWLTRAAANQAQMQGSIEVATGRTSMGDGRTRMFNVHENNGIPYDPHQKNGDLQRRFWYFREVEGILGVEQIPLRPGAAVAGDIWNVGLGKIVALEWAGATGPEVHLVVLADTGGAFQPNLFQLDWLAGAFPSHDAFEAWERTMPSRVRASVLLRKETGTTGDRSGQE
ncbi:MAG: hypothetical protein ABMB14_25055 [Myxococcota bacterium]